MLVHFSKYHGTGNDFVMIDGRKQDTSVLNAEVISRLCNRRFGVGGDGLIILENSKNFDFTMRYFNADGTEDTMCGNGGRCIAVFAKRSGVASNEITFEAADGLHTASFLPNGDVCLKLVDVKGIEQFKDGYLLNTGSPHFVKHVDDLNSIDVEKTGAEIRHQQRFGEGGVNVNFVELTSSTDQILVRTYERGVEAETLSCGTGVTAAAISSCFHTQSDNFSYKILTRGGELSVSFKSMENRNFSEIYLSGPALHVYDGSIDIVV